MTKTQPKAESVENLETQLAQLIRQHVESSVNVKQKEIDTLNENMKQQKGYFQEKLVKATTSILDQQEQLLKTNRHLFKVMAEGMAEGKQSSPKQQKQEPKKKYEGSRPIAIPTVSITPKKNGNTKKTSDMRSKPIAINQQQASIKRTTKTKTENKTKPQHKIISTTKDRPTTKTTKTTSTTTTRSTRFKYPLLQQKPIRSRL